MKLVIGDIGQGPQSNQSYTKVALLTHWSPSVGWNLLEWFRSLTAGEFLTDRSLALSTPGSLKVFVHSCSHSTNIWQQESEQICSTERVVLAAV